MMKNIGRIGSLEQVTYNGRRYVRVSDLQPVSVTPVGNPFVNCYPDYISPTMMDLPNEVSRSIASRMGESLETHIERSIRQEIRYNDYKDRANAFSIDVDQTPLRVDYTTATIYAVQLYHIRAPNSRGDDSNIRNLSGNHWNIP
jgi:hypothetical protein